MEFPEEAEAFALPPLSPRPVWGGTPVREGGLTGRVDIPIFGRDKAGRFRPDRAGFGL